MIEESRDHSDLGKDGTDSGTGAAGACFGSRGYVDKTRSVTSSQERKLGAAFETVLPIFYCSTR